MQRNLQQIDTRTRTSIYKERATGTRASNQLTTTRTSNR